MNEILNGLQEIITNTSLIDEYFDWLYNDLMGTLNPMSDQLEAIMLVMFALIALQIITVVAVFSLKGQVKHLKGELENEQSNNNGDTGNRSIGA